MQHFDQRPHQGSTDPYLIVSLQRCYYVMCDMMVGCVVVVIFCVVCERCTSTKLIISHCILKQINNHLLGGSK